ncbi:HAD family phosphatase [Enterobacteriaceae bacterium H18W14]|uniref:HAD family hydrolase n=1 Tax=Dryocola boscaweniae TaxID=2925397 RepID=UPI0022F040D3|nr:HAD family phosphatase [Dryocola boscaweniae]MCT4716211.1 HAD family phosphatase [Dryocola boscaweniae]
MTKNLLCFDLDGTLTRRELLPLIANEVGLEHEFEVLTKLTVEGTISFEESLRLRFAILKNIPVDIVQQIICHAELFGKIIEFIRNNSERCFVITGNLDIWIETLMKNLGCRYFSSKVTASDNRLQSLDYILNKSTAINVLKRDYPQHNIIAFGDGLNDYPMFEAADKSVAIGLTHQPSRVLISKSNYVIYEEEALCRLLNTL